VSLRQHEIAEVDHRILDPFSESKLRLIGELADVGPGTRVLDLACGKGELVCRWAEWFGASGTGVDLSEVFLAAARARATELGVTDRITFVHGDAGAYVAEPGGFDVASCLGATWIGGGLVGTAKLLRRAIHDDGRILIGEPYWIEPPPQEALDRWEMRAGEFASLAATEGRLASAGLELIELVVASPDDWDRYEAAQWRAMDRWLRTNPDDPMHAQIRDALDHWRETYLRWGRRHMGWAVFVTRPAWRRP
jgi:SAM-dependent methyltransferase